MRLFAALIAIAAFPAAAAAQSGESSGLTLYDYPNFQGASVMVSREVPNLGPGGFDDMTTSMRVGSGSWEICSAPDFRGVCRVVTSDVWDLEALGLNNQVSSIRPARSAGPAPGPLPPAYGGEERARLVLYEGTGFRGRSASFYGRADSLQRDNFDNRAASAEVDGVWVLCERANLSGRCEEVSGDVADLGRLALDGRISSAAPIGGPGPGGPYDPGPADPYDPYPGGQQRSLEGERAIFFPRPELGRYSLRDCLNGDRRACEAEVDRFCRSQGWREGAYYTPDRRAGTLTDVLCVR